MSDPQTVFRLGVAFFCAAGAAWMKFGSGVSDDDQSAGNAGIGKARDVRGDVSEPRLRSGFLGGVPDRGAAVMGHDEHRGQVIYLLDRGIRPSVHAWGSGNGFPPKSGTDEVK